MDIDLVTVKDTTINISHLENMVLVSVYLTINYYKIMSLKKITIKK